MKDPQHVPHPPYSMFKTESVGAAMFRPIRRLLVKLLARIITKDDLQWIVNSDRELGIRLENRKFFFWRAMVFEYSKDDLQEDEENGEPPLRYRPCFQHEFGYEAVRPITDANHKFGPEDWKNV